MSDADKGTDHSMAGRSGLSYRTRRRLSLLILVVGLPLYIVAAVTAMNWLDARFGRQPVLVELLVYLLLGLLWAAPFRGVFLGIGQPDPDAGTEEERPESRSP